MARQFMSARYEDDTVFTINAKNCTVQIFAASSANMSIESNFGAHVFSKGKNVILSDTTGSNIFVKLWGWLTGAWGGQSQSQRSGKSSTQIQVGGKNCIQIQARGSIHECKMTGNRNTIEVSNVVDSSVRIDGDDVFVNISRDDIENNGRVIIIKVPLNKKFTLKTGKIVQQFTLNDEHLTECISMYI